MRKIIAAAALFISMGVYAEPEIGKKAPAFSGVDIEGKTYSIADSKGKYVVLEWTNHGCPFVKKHYETGNMQALQNELTGKGVTWISVASSAKGKEGHMSAADWKKEIVKQKSAASLTLLDETGKIGRLYGAKTTPHMFVINPEGILIYAGAIDDQPSYEKSTVAGAKNHVKAAVDESMEGKTVSTPSTKAYGCSVKY